MPPNLSPLTNGMHLCHRRDCVTLWKLAWLVRMMATLPFKQRGGRFPELVTICVKGWDAIPRALRKSWFGANTQIIRMA